MALVAAYPNGIKTLYLRIEVVRTFVGSEHIVDMHLSKEGSMTIIKECIECKFSGGVLDVYY